MATILALSGLPVSRLSAPVPSSGTRVDALYAAPDAFATLPYRSIFRTQPEVRVVIEFLGRNIAQLGLFMYERVDDTDRRRDTDHEVIRTLSRPTPWLTRYRLIQQTVVDMACTAHAFWVVVTDRRDWLQWLVPVPPERMRALGDIVPGGYLYCPHGRDSDQDVVPLTRDQVVHFVYSDGTSPLETLRQVLSEARASRDYRANLWRNHARIGGVVQRPIEAGPWSVEARDRWRQQFSAKYTGAANAGRVLVLEEGMTFQGTSQTSLDSEWSVGYRLTREDAARAYHIPLTMVGILEHSTFSNIKEQHRHLYQDCLGPWLEDLTQAIELQLLAQFANAEGRYLEFNIQAKMAGSFEEQAAALQTSVGGPWLTVNEARARMNLPRLPEDDKNKVLAPLNMTTNAGDAFGNTQREEVPA